MASLLGTVDQSKAYVLPRFLLKTGMAKYRRTMEQGEQLELVWSLLGHHILHEGWRDKKTKKKTPKRKSLP